MPKRATIDKLGQFGVVSDPLASEIPPNAWSSAANVRCKNNRIEVVDGYDELTSLANPGIHVASLQTTSNNYTVYAVDNDADGIAEKIYAYEVAETNITRQIAAVDDDYGGTNQIWTHTYLSGALVLNNAEDAPQYWIGSGKCLNMPYTGANDWESTAGGGETYRAKSIRAFKNYLFAINITDNGARYPHMVHVSGAVAPGDIANIDWDYTDDTIDSFRRDLPDTPGQCIDGLALRDSFLIYKQDAIYSFTYSGDEFVFQSRLLTKKRGILTQNCVVDIGGRHIVVGTKDVYIHDGTRFDSVTEDRVRNEIFGQMDKDYYQQTYLVHNKKEFEVWVCFTTSGNMAPNLAWVYNYRTGQWSPRDIPGLRFISDGFVNEANLSVPEFYSSEVVFTYDYETSWDYTIQIFDPIAETLIGIKNNIVAFDGSETVEDVAIMARIERTDLDLGDPDDWHEIQAVYPRMTGDPVNIRIGSQASVNGPVTWADAVSFDPESDVSAYMLVNGRRHAIQITGGKFALDALSFDYVETGRE